MDKLIPSFKDSIFNDYSKTLFIDIAEIGIDSMLNDNLLKELPIIATFIGITQTGQKITERNLIKQTLAFINALNQGELSQDKLRRYQKQLEENPLKAERELGRVIILLNTYIDDIKSCILARIFKAYIYETITWNIFCEFSDILSRLFVSDIIVLSDLFYSSNLKHNESNLNRLSSLGLSIPTSMKLLDALLSAEDSSDSLTELGHQFCEIAFIQPKDI